MKSDDDLLRRILSGDQVAWMTLFTQYGPVIERIARTTRSMGSYRTSRDDVRNVMAQVFERLRRDDYRALRTFPGWLDRNPGRDLTDWLTIVTVNVARNYIAAKLGAPSDDGTPIKQLVNTLADAMPLEGAPGAPLVRPHITTKETAHRIFAYARDHLEDDQLAALTSWLEGASFDEIAGELHLADTTAAERLVRSALARLRRKFA